MDNYIYANEGAMEPFAWNDTSESVFKKIIYRLSDITTAHTSKPNFFRENAWHLSTLLNTFNAYYCYDVSPFRDDEVPSIRPIFVRMWATREVRRLLSIEVLLADENKYDDFVLHFDDATNIITSIAAISFAVGDTSYEVVAENELPPRDERPRPERCIVRYSTNDNPVTEIMPFRCDVLVAPSNAVTMSGVFRDLRVNMRYVSDARIVTTAKYSCTGPPNYRSDGINDDTLKKTLYAYIFGADMGYLNANFDKYGSYSPKSRIAWPIADNRDPMLAQMIEYSKIYAPTEKQLALPVYKPTDYVREIERVIVQHAITIDLLSDKVERCIALATNRPLQRSTRIPTETNTVSPKTGVAPGKLENTLQYMNETLLYTNEVVEYALLLIKEDIDDKPDDDAVYQIVRRSLSNETFIRGDTKSSLHLLT